MQTHARDKCEEVQCGDCICSCTALTCVPVHNNADCQVDRHRAPTPPSHTMVATSLLSGKRALITGSSRGIGSCIAVNYAKQGASLILVARSKENLEKVCTAMH